MFCHECGAENPDEARFCASCGQDVSDTAAARPFKPTASEDDPVVVLKPVFVPCLALLSVLPLQIFMAFWGAGFLGGFSCFAIKALDLPIPMWAPFVFFGVLFFCGIPLLVYLITKKTYARTEYRFRHGHMDYYEGFFNVEEKTIPLANVTEVHLRRGFFQKKYGLGTIVLSTPATGGLHAQSGIRIQNVKNPEVVYRDVKRLVERARNGSRRAA